MGGRDKPGNDSGGALTGPEPLRVQAGGRGRGGGVASSQKTTLPGPLPTPESVAQMLEFQGLSALSRFRHDPSPQVKPPEPRSREMITGDPCRPARSEEHTSEIQSLMRTSYAVFCLKQKTKQYTHTCQFT